MAHGNFGIIILAAGNSTRLGEPKQLLAFQHKTLIRHITESAIASEASQTVVVTGANRVLIEHELAAPACELVHNPGWEEGMASSIRAGLTHLLHSKPEIEGVLLAVSDQPYVSASVFDTLVAAQLTSNMGIAASSYGETLGTPVYFTSTYFDVLLALTGAAGAKKLLKQFSTDIISVPFPLGAIDIDTPADYQNLLTRNNQ